uniref:Secreted protein n=1 Tax=Timema poppense TaxID=170557 RepID=A0A7R9HFG7_TIMPO|nr:unnamed protein product [Timema poppensis]
MAALLQLFLLCLVGDELIMELVVAKSPPSQLCLKVMYWGKKELLATSTNQRCETCLIFEERMTTQKRKNDNAVSQ